MEENATFVFSTHGDAAHPPHHQETTWPSQVTTLPRLRRRYHSLGPRNPLNPVQKMTS